LRIFSRRLEPKTQLAGPDLKNGLREIFARILHALVPQKSACQITRAKEMAGLDK
jgi:hypothetical protein